MPSVLIYPLAALAEIAGCFAIRAWWWGASIFWLLPGIASLAVFGWLLAQVEAGFAGRAYASYGASTSPRRCSGCGAVKDSGQSYGTSLVPACA